MNKLAFFIDIDGTLIYDGNLPLRNGEAIQKAREDGHYVFVNTGRAMAVVPDMVLKCAQFDGLITGLGSYITIGNKVIHESGMAKDVFDKVFPIVMKYHPLFGGAAFCAAVADRRVDIPLSAVVESREDIPDIPIHKISALGIAAPEDAAVFKKYFELYQHGTYFEMCSPGNSKATGIKRVAEYLAEESIKTVAIGDSLNDIPMFEAADYCGAMGDTVEEIKNMADYVSCDAALGGVADVIEYFCSREDI